MSEVGDSGRRSAPSVPPRAPQRQNRGLFDWLDRALGLIAAVTLFFMMLVTFFDVLLRKFPVFTFPAADELTKLALGVLVFSALPVVTRHEEHVVISLFDPLFSRRWKVAKLAFIDVFSALVLAILAWRLGVLALRTLATDYTLFIGAPLAPFAWFMAATASLAALLALGLAVSRFRAPTSTA